MHTHIHTTACTLSSITSLSCLLAAEAQATTVFSSRSLSKKPKECIPLPTSDLEADAGGRKKKGRRVLQKRKEGEFRRIPAVGVFGCILLLPPPQLLCEELPEEKKRKNGGRCCHSTSSRLKIYYSKIVVV